MGQVGLLHSQADRQQSRQSLPKRCIWAGTRHRLYRIVTSATYGDCRLSDLILGIKKVERLGVALLAVGAEAGLGLGGGPEGGAVGAAT